MRNFELRPALLILAIAGSSVYGCGDNHDSSTPAPAPVPAVCSTAFDTAADGFASAALRPADEPAPVALSSCQLDANRNVQIGGAGGCGPDVVVDKDFTGGNGLGKITISSGGKLVFPDLADPELKTPNTLNVETAGILVDDGGLFSIGTATCPIGFHPKAHVTITFTGERNPACQPSTGCNDGSIKGLEVRSGGILRLFGAKGVPHPADGAGPGGVSWTVLSAPVVPVKDKGVTLHLAADVTQGQRPWEDGDWIAIGTSSFSPYETEFVQIQGTPTQDGMGGSNVTTAQPLQYAHFGSAAPTASQQCSVGGKLQAVACGSVAGCTAPCTAAPSLLNYNDPETQNFGIDERAEVGLISRSIKLTATTPAAPPPDQEPLNADKSLHWGGEIRIVGGNTPPQVAIVGVELEKFGKDQLGSYPIHFHMLGDAKNAPNISANSIHHGFNKCITVHMTSNLSIQDNVCARIVGHLFYEEYGAEENVSFQNNLGLGAMSNSFDIYKVRTNPGTTPPDIARSKLIHDYWWTGDNLANAAGYNYDGFNIPNTDEQKNPTHGSCQRPDGNGGFGSSLPPYSTDHPTECTADEFYTEPANGFWITNPTTELIGNAIGGCQGVGRGFWWVTPPSAIMVNGAMEDLKFKPLGISGHPQAFFDNRAHACYAGFYGEEEYSVASSVLVPHKDGTSTGQPIIAEMDGMTATRNRFRGVWLRPTWFVVKDGRFATNRENVSLVTSGGIDGNAPGVWALLEDSVIAGVSRNNVSRFGPCPTENQLGNYTGSQFGCIDHTPVIGGPPAAHSADEVGLGYPPPSWNMFGYMLYDGPVRVFHDRFVNFKADISPLLTADDNTFLTKYSAGHNTPTAQACVSGKNKGHQCNTPADCCANAADCPNSCPLPNVVCSGGVSTNCCQKAEGCNIHFTYEGDAALGWFQSNQSSYPTGTVTRELSFANTDLRHQIYTEKVSVNLTFNDGDKNTAVIDEDGTLTGYGVKSPTGVHPISLNNLPFNATSNSVDECFSRGRQNDAFEGRDSSLISPGSMGTLEFSSLYPWKTTDKDMNPVAFPGPDGDVTHAQFMTFQRDDTSVDANSQPFHPAMTLHSRDGRGVWEPKVTSGFGYTASAAPIPTSPTFPNSTGRAGIPNILDVGIADVVKPKISAADPFFIRLGICYTNADGMTHPRDPAKFSITRGYKSYTGGFVDPNDPQLLKYWSPSACNNLDSLNTKNITEPACPGPRQRLVPAPNSGSCPTGSTLSGDGKSCVFPTDNLDRVDDPAQMLNADGTPNLETFAYDKNTGMLFLWVAQDEENPVATSPLGSCAPSLCVGGANAGKECAGAGDCPSGTCTNPVGNDPACPDLAHEETYYACPAKGCHVYLIKLDDQSYSPGTSNCAPYETYTHAPFKTPEQLTLYGTQTSVSPVLGFDKTGDPFHTPSDATAPKCDTTTTAAASLAARTTQQSATTASSRPDQEPSAPVDAQLTSPPAPDTTDGSPQTDAPTPETIATPAAAASAMRTSTPTCTPGPKPLVR